MAFNGVKMTVIWFILFISRAIYSPTKVIIVIGSLQVN